MFKHGDPVRCLFIVVSGQFSLTQQTVEKLDRTEEKPQTLMHFIRPGAAAQASITVPRTQAVRTANLYSVEQGIILGLQELTEKRDVY